MLFFISSFKNSFLFPFAWKQVSIAGLQKFMLIFIAEDVLFPSQKMLMAIGPS